MRKALKPYQFPVRGTSTKGHPESAMMEEGNSASRVKGRGHSSREEEDRFEGRGGVFETIEQEPGAGPSQSIEGWIIFVTNLHEEAQEEDILDKFSEYGDVKNIAVNLDRRTGFVKGYALVEFEQFDEATNAIRGMNGKKILGQEIKCDWAFVKSE